ncbi:hypothetical protein ACGFJC_47100 [Nonomuraea fuscirosea]|uniref:hypothetical protein n=1 Tax=Nonomuraea fuscirosea TaxID=1291556 RepID=UPI00371C110B
MTVICSGRTVETETVNAADVRPGQLVVDRYLDFTTKGMLGVAWVREVQEPVQELPKGLGWLLRCRGEIYLWQPGRPPGSVRLLAGAFEGPARA